MTEQVDLKFFAGKSFMLTAVESGVRSEPSSWGYPINMLSFTLSGVTFRAEEDPSDGYRSSLDTIRVLTGDEAKLKNTFPPQRVVARLSSGSNADMVVFCDANTGKVVIEVGTVNTDDYYPCFVAHFSPENMAINASDASLVTSPDIEPERETVRQLTAEGQADRDDFMMLYGGGNCSCHISPPCESCIHPGNPNNQAEDDSCWEVVEVPDEPVLPTNYGGW